jgi:CDP-glycerol glycerophosphotransferase
VDERLAVFAAYWYRGYACNPAAIYEAAREGAPWLRGVWVVERGREHTLPEGVPYVVAGSGAYLRLMATAKYLVNNVNFPHDVPKRAGQVEVQTQHGTPLKTVGEDLRAFPRGAAGMNFARLREHVARWDYLVSPSPYASRVWERAYPGRYELLEVGYPRDDVLAVADARRVAAARAALGVPEGVIVVLYAPTHREQHEGFVPLLDVPGLARALGEKYVVLVRAHYFYADQGVSVGGGVDAVARAGGGVARVIDVTGHPRVEELSLAADVLVSDYSSLLTDYAVLDRPMVLHVPDWEVYRRVRGVYVDLVREPPGVVTTSLAELVAAFTSGAVFGPEAAAARAAFRARFCPHEDGRAAERVVRAVFTPPAGGGWG